jgi:beta-N-acetylhexosaminidase
MMKHSPVIIDIAGTQLTAVDRRRLRHPLTGGLILFGRNWVDRQQLCDLTAEIKSVRPDLLVCVDHEGGRVQRFKTDGFTHLPSMRSIGDRWIRDTHHQPGSGAMQAIRYAVAAGYILGAELHSCGVDLSFTPILDLDYGESTVIGDRAFHSDPRVVTLLAQALMQGLMQAGLKNCGKHFPGHGYVQADSHTDVPIDHRTLSSIIQADCKPYEWLNTTLASIMPAHVIYPEVDKYPAGFSAKWLQNILRQKLQFQGAIFSDDLSMEGARHLPSHEGQLTYTQAAILALKAGCDMVLLCNQSLGDGQAVDDLLDELYVGVQQNAWIADPQSESRRLHLIPTNNRPRWNDLLASTAYQQAKHILVTE